MPNWVYQRLRAWGAPGDLEAFIDRLPVERGDDGSLSYQLDFNAWIQRPAALDIESGGQGEVGEQVLTRPRQRLSQLLGGWSWAAKLWQALPEGAPTGETATAHALARWLDAQPQMPLALASDEVSKALANWQAMLRLGRQRVLNRQRWGHPDWYSWSLEHWGTQWNGGRCTVHRPAQGGVELHYATARSAPEPVLHAIWRSHPRLRFSVDYLDEGFGFAGSFEFGPGIAGGFSDVPAGDIPNFARAVFDWDCDDPDTDEDDPEDGVQADGPALSPLTPVAKE